jgi:hypothetical protein
LFNAYGPTETTVCASWHQVEGDCEHTVPIGGPLANMRLYLVDAHDRPTPIGVTGEICVAGVGLARGYLGRPDLSAARFVDNPFEPGERMYRTGDLGRWLPDGTVEYIGRNDFQVKLRGFRIEPGEIESRLMACDGVDEAIVLLREDRAGQPQLVAYVTSARTVDRPTPAGLRAALTGSLAAYMVPSAVVVLDAMPLTSNRKIDRKALPAPDRETQTADRVAPRDELEAGIAAVWAEVLGLSQVGIHETFFELGGNSLQIVKLHATLQAQFPGQLAIADYFRHTTVARLAEHLRGGQDGSGRVEQGSSRAELRRQRQADQQRNRERRGRTTSGDNTD